MDIRNVVMVAAGVCALLFAGLSLMTGLYQRSVGRTDGAVTDFQISCILATIGVGCVVVALA